MKTNDILDLVTRIKLSNNISIIFHESPDGDAIGSSLGLLLGLRKLGKNVNIISKEVVPDYLNFLPHTSEISTEISEVPSNTDCVIVVDCGDVKRINAKNLSFESRNYVLLNIDHHLTNEMYGDINYIDTDSIATAQIIYKLLITMNIEIDKEIAENLYAGLLTDSGSFKYPKTSDITHNIAGNLINTGINFTDIHRKLFENKPINKVKLYGKVIENIKMYLNNKICVLKLTKNLLDELNIDENNTGDIVSIGTQIDTVEVTVLLKESSKGTKVSLRSKEIVDVRKIAEKFNGGGHTRAAGLLLEMPIEEAEKLIIKTIEEEFN